MGGCFTSGLDGHSRWKAHQSMLLLARWRWTWTWSNTAFWLLFILQCNWLGLLLAGRLLYFSWKGQEHVGSVLYSGSAQHLMIARWDIIILLSTTRNMSWYIWSVTFWLNQHDRGLILFISLSLSPSPSLSFSVCLTNYPAERQGRPVLGCRRRRPALRPEQLCLGPGHSPRQNHPHHCTSRRQRRAVRDPRRQCQRWNMQYDIAS